MSHATLYATDDAILTAVDRSGRLVVPKSVREILGIVAGTPLRMAVRDGRIEIEPAYSDIRTVERDGLHVAELVEPLPPLSEDAVRATRAALRERRS